MDENEKREIEIIAQLDASVETFNKCIVELKAMHASMEVEPQEKQPKDEDQPKADEERQEDGQKDEQEADDIDDEENVSRETNDESEEGKDNEKKYRY